MFKTKIMQFPMCEITNELQLKHMWGNEISKPGRDQLSMSLKLELIQMSYVHKLYTTQIDYDQDLILNIFKDLSCN
jgi:hypothetical protein